MTQRTEGYWAALVAYDPVELTVRRTTLITNNDSTTERERFYEALLKISWLAPAVRGAVLRELGRSLREEKRKIEKAQTVTLQFLVDEEKARLRQTAARPRGGIGAAAIEETARRTGTSVDALEQRLKRFRRRPVSP